MVLVIVLKLRVKNLFLALGYSHPVNFPIPDGITIDVEKMTKLVC